MWFDWWYNSWFVGWFWLVSWFVGPWWRFVMQFRDVVSGVLFVCRCTLVFFVFLCVVGFFCMSLRRWILFVCHCDVDFFSFVVAPLGSLCLSLGHWVLFVCRCAVVFFSSACTLWVSLCSCRFNWEWVFDSISLSFLETKHWVIFYSLTLRVTKGDRNRFEVAAARAAQHNRMEWRVTRTSMRMKSSWVLCPVLRSDGCIARTQVQVKRCRDDGFNFWDIAAVMVEEHNELRTIRLLRIVSMWSIMKGTRRVWTASRGKVWLVKNFAREVQARFPHEEPSWTCFHRQSIREAKFRRWTFGAWRWLKLRYLELRMRILERIRRPWRRWRFVGPSCWQHGYWGGDEGQADLIQSTRRVCVRMDKMAPRSGVTKQDGRTHNRRHREEFFESVQSATNTLAIWLGGVEKHIHTVYLKSAHHCFAVACNASFSGSCVVAIFSVFVSVWGRIENVS